MQKIGQRGSLGVLLAALLVAVLVAVAVLVTRAQTQAEEAAKERFAERAQIAATLTQSVFSALGSLSGEQLERRYSGSEASIEQVLERQHRSARLLYLALLDARGRVLAIHGDRPAAARLPRKPAGPLVSDVYDAGSARVIEFSIPFGEGAQRRVLVEGVPLSTFTLFLDGFLTKVRSIDGSGLAIADGHGVVLTRMGQVDPAGNPAGDRHSAAARVPGTSWTLRVEADRARVLFNVDRLRWITWILLTALAMTALAGIWLYGRTLVYVRRQRKTNAELQESRDQIHNLVDALEEAVFLHHADGRTELLNASARALVGSDEAVISGLDDDWDLLDQHGKVLPGDKTPTARVLASGEATSDVLGLRRPDGSSVWLAIRARPLIRPGEDRPHAVVASCTDVTEQREVEQHLTDLAQRDPLTGLWNRRRFEDDLAKQLARCRRYDETAALIVFDLDGFKQVNDTLGHLAGDEVLRALADGLNRRLRASDCAARIGGDEFAVLLLGVVEDSAHAMAAEVATRLTAFARQQLDVSMDLTVSAGVAMLDARAGGVAEAFAVADRAMYANKRAAGRKSAAQGEPGDTASSVIGSEAAPAPGRAPAYLPSLRALLTAVQARDSYTAVHSRQVVTLARAVARRLDLDDATVGEVESAALLHDLGKIAVPDAILRKSGPLNLHEEEVMRQHPVVGAQMVASIPELAHLAPAIRAEHERWDGAGYPDGLCGEAIPLSSRIAFVCDAYHAMTSDRPYRKALSREDAMAEIEAQAGRQFCPLVAEALLGVLAAEVVEAA